MNVKSILKTIARNAVKQPRNFSYAFEGIAFCLQYEKSLRIHFIVTAYAIYFSYFYHFSKVEFLLVLIVCASEISSELMNTAVECVVDKVSPERHILAKAAKDVASGAVCIFALLEVATFFILFIDKVAFREISAYFSNPLPISLLILSIVLSIVFIFYGQSRQALSNKKYIEKYRNDKIRMERFLKKQHKLIKFLYGVDDIPDDKEE